MVFSLYISLVFSFSCIDRQLSFFILSLLLSTESRVHTSLPWPRWWCTEHKYWSFCSAIWYFQYRTINLERSTTAAAPPEPSHNQKHSQANTQVDACEWTDSTYAEDIADESSDLTQLDTEGGEILGEEKVTGEDEEETMVPPVWTIPV
jgi:hypothetical protein